MYKQSTLEGDKSAWHKEYGGSEQRKIAMSEDLYSAGFRNSLKDSEHTARDT